MSCKLVLKPSTYAEPLQKSSPGLRSAMAVIAVSENAVPTSSGVEVTLCSPGAAA